jgi:outer membrane cobalamin receptor
VFVLEKKFSRVMFVAAALAFFAASAAASVIDMPEEKVIAEVAVSEDKYLSPGDVTVIRPEDFKGEARTAGELLQRVPGVTVPVGNSQVTAPYIRGSHPLSVAIYVDGVNVNMSNDMMYAAALERVPFDQIERIEVYKGFVPARFGHQAMGGVINIVTKTPKEAETNFSVTAGSYGRLNATVSHSEPAWGGAYSFAVGYESYGGDFDYFNAGMNYPIAGYSTTRAPQNLENVSFNLKYRDENWRARFSRSERKWDALYGVTDDPATPYGRPPLFDWGRWDFSVGRTQNWGRLRWGWDFAYVDVYSGYESFGVWGYSSPMLFKRTEFSLHGDMPVGERHTISAVAEVASQSYEYGGALDRWSELSLNLQDEIALDAAGTFFFTPSLRYNEMDGFGKFTWQAALSKEFSNGVMLKTSYGTYSRIPNVYERFGDGVYYLPAPDLKAETGTQFDAGISWRGVVKSLKNADVDVSLTGYWRESKNLISGKEIDPINWVYQYENQFKATVKGIEFATALDWEKWKVALSATYTDSENHDDPSSPTYNPLTDGRRRSYLPEWDATLRLTRKFSKGSIFAEYQHIGDFYVNNYYKYQEESDVFNLGAQYQINDTFTLSAGVNDVFDEMNDIRQYDPVTYPGRGLTPAFPYAGRAFYVTLDARF